MNTQSTILFHPTFYFLFPFNSVALYHAAPPNVITMPIPFNHPTLTPKTMIPNKTVKHCFTLPQTVMVSAPVFLFAENDATFNTNARMPFPAKAKAWFREGRVEGVAI